MAAPDNSLEPTPVSKAPYIKRRLGRGSTQSLGDS
jgi:hypothetical protein